MGDLLSRRRMAFVLVCTSMCAMLVACASVLGIEDKPLRVESDSSTVDAPAESGDAGVDAACNVFESHACSMGCAHDFCDDFDDDAQAPETHWKTPIGFNNPFTRGDSGVALVPTGRSLPMALSAATQTSSAKTYGMLANLLAFKRAHPGQAFEGVRIAADFRVDKLELTSNGGPVPDAGSAAVLGMLRSDVIPPKGLAIVLSGRSLYLDVSEDVLDSIGTDIVGVITPDIDPNFLVNNWLQLEIFVGDRERAVSLGYAKCASAEVSPGLVAVGALGGKSLGMACLNVPTTFGQTSWPEDAIMLAGTLLFGSGEAAFRIDNVVADFFVK